MGEPLPSAPTRPLSADLLPVLSFLSLPLRYVQIQGGQVSFWGEFRLDKLNDLSQNCIMMVVIESQVSCHTAVVENMQ